MSDGDFVQERAYVYEYTIEELEALFKRKTNGAITQEEDERHDGVIIIDILGE